MTTTSITPYERIQRALALAYRHGQTAGDHHKAWVIDQMVRELAGDNYPGWVELFECHHPAGRRNKWWTGIAP